MQLYLGSLTNLFSIILAVLFFSSMQSCKGDKKKSEEDRLSNPIKEVVSEDANNHDYRASALSILEFRNKKTGGENFAIIEADKWEYKNVFSRGNMSADGEYDGVWVDFMPDNKYVYGKNKEIQGEGKYHYDIETSVILMVDNDPSKKPQEWTTKHAGDVMIMVGTEEYRDNSIQMKLERVADNYFD